MSVEKRILLGHIRAAHGIRGEVSIQTYTADPEDIAAYGPLSDEAGQRSVTITHVRATPKGVVARIAGVTDRNAAEGLRGLALTVRRDALPPPEDGDYYHADLIGLDAVAPDGTALGHVVAVQNFGAGDLLEIRLAGRKETEFIPFTDACVPVVDFTAQRVTVVRPATVDGDEKDTPE